MFTKALVQFLHLAGIFFYIMPRYDANPKQPESEEAKFVWFAAHIMQTLGKAKYVCTANSLADGIAVVYIVHHCQSLYTSLT